MGNFAKLPSGIIINMERISFIGRINAHREKHARKPKSWSLSIQFIDEDEPTILSYYVENEARADYNALFAACELNNAR